MVILEALDRGSAVPLYFQIRTSLLEHVRTGALKPGELMPSEGEICSQLGVSRMTARQAVKSLCDVGVAYSIRGKGTFVSGAKHEKNFRQALSFSEEMRRRGWRPKAQVISFRVVESSAEAAKALHLPRKEKIISLRRVRFANSIPMGLEWSCIPLRLCPKLMETFDPSSSLYQALARHGIRIALADETVEAGLAGAEDARFLEIPKNSPVFQFTRISYLHEGKPVEFVRSTYRGDRYRIVNRLTRPKADWRN